MADVTRSTMLKRIREVNELAEAAYWQLLDLRVLLNKAEAGLTAAGVNSSDSDGGILGGGEHYADAEEYRPGGGEPQ